MTSCSVVTSTIAQLLKMMIIKILLIVFVYFLSISYLLMCMLFYVFLGGGGVVGGGRSGQSKLDSLFLFSDKSKRDLPAIEQENGWRIYGESLNYGRRPNWSGLELPVRTLLTSVNFLTQKRVVDAITCIRHRGKHTVTVRRLVITDRIPTVSIGYVVASRLYFLITFKR